MRENLEHHIEEEEDEMFGQARQLFDKETLETLGEQMRTIKSQARAA
jgi:hemerythrin-like domain-containing protein